MNTIQKFLATAIAALVVLAAFFILFRLNRQHKHESERLSRTLSQTVQQLKQIETRSGQLAAENEVMQLKLKELTMLYPKLVTELHNLKINPRRAGQISATGYRAEQDIKVALHDSVTTDTFNLKVFSYRDNWYDIRGIADDSLQKLHLRYQDTLIQVIYLGKRTHPWLWFLSPRSLRQRVVLKNPGAHIGYAELIQIERRKH
jgi:hypothetical protein